MLNGTKLLAAFAVCMAVVAACEDSTDVSDTNLHYAGLLTSAKEKPTANSSTATGQALVVINSANTLSYSVTWAGLTAGGATGAHIHGPADSLNTAAVIINFAALPAGSTQPVANVMTATGSSSGNVNVAPGAAIATGVTGDSITKWLSEGKLYVNVHTAANGGGEIRAQLIKQ